MNSPLIHTLYFRDSSSCPFAASGSVHLAVTSPPYPLIEMWDPQFSSGSPAVRDALLLENGPLAFRHMHEKLDAVWAEMYRLLLPGGFLCVNIGDAARRLGGTFRLYSNHARITETCCRLGFDALPIVHWWKPTNAPTKFMGSGMLPAGAYVTLEHEYVLIFRKGGKREFMAEAEKQVRCESAIFWEERNEWFSDRWVIGAERQSARAGLPRQRSAAFPFELAYRLINMYSIKGDTVLDPFLGTGTTTLAAMASARRSMGVEIDRGFRKAILTRIESCCESLNEHIRKRIEAHRRFAEERRKAGRPLAYRNAAYGFPVMTRQETGMKLESLARIEPRKRDSYAVYYR